MTKGMKTSEFWISMLAAVLGVFVAAGWITPEQSSTLVESATTIAGAIISALAVFGYAVGRGLAKSSK